MNNAIVLIDTYNRLRSEGVPVREAVLKTSAQRFRPIMLTTITTIMGLIPMALTINLNFFSQIISVGSITAVWWVQLSTAIISGLAFSTLLTLVLIPVMLTLPINVVDLVKRWRGERAGDAIADAVEKPTSKAPKFPKKKRVSVKKLKETGPSQMPDAAE